MLDMNELTTGSGKAIDLDAVGDSIEGSLTGVGEWREMNTNYGPKIKSPFNLVIDGEERTLWVKKGSRLATVIGQAFKDAGLASIATGGVLKVKRIENVSTTKGNPMHDFRAKYTPSASATPAPDLDDF